MVALFNKPFVQNYKYRKLSEITITLNFLHYPRRNRWKKNTSFVALYLRVSRVFCLVRLSQNVNRNWFGCQISQKSSMYDESADVFTATLAIV